MSCCVLGQNPRTGREPEIFFSSFITIVSWFALVKQNAFVCDCSFVFAKHTVFACETEHIRKPNQKLCFSDIVVSRGKKQKTLPGLKCLGVVEFYLLVKCLNEDSELSEHKQDFKDSSGPLLAQQETSCMRG